MDTTNREIILAEIRRLADVSGHTPRQKDLERELRISSSQIFKHFPRWTDAVRAAGLQPFKPQISNRAREADLLEDWATSVRTYGKLPTISEYQLQGKFHNSTFHAHFGSWRNLPARFGEFAAGNPEWADVEDILKNDTGLKPYATVSRPKRSKDGDANAESAHQDSEGHEHGNMMLPRIAIDTHPNDSTYGPPINFRGLQHEPVNEQGVVFVFGMVAKELGYFVEAVQQGFPDCEAKREAIPGRFKRIRIEFGSKNFLAHGHPLDGCDLIVCWRDNWLNRPSSLEVLELSSAIKKLPNR